MNSIAGFREQAISEDEVCQFFEGKREAREEPGRRLRYFCRGVADVPADWERNIDAAKLLEDAFRELSEARVSYEKMTHSVAITEWLIANRPAALDEIARFLVLLLPLPGG